MNSLIATSPESPKPLLQYCCGEQSTECDIHPEKKATPSSAAPLGLCFLWDPTQHALTAVLPWHCQASQTPPHKVQDLYSDSVSQALMFSY